MQLFCSRDKELKDKGFPCVQQQTATSYQCEITDPFHNVNKSSKSSGWREHLNVTVTHGASTEPWEPRDMQDMSSVFPVIRSHIYVTYFVNANEEKGPSHCVRFPFTTSPHLHANTVCNRYQLSKWISTTKPLSYFCFSSIPFLYWLPSELLFDQKKRNKQ